MYSRALRLSCGVLALIAISAAAFLLIHSEEQISRQAAALRAFDQQARDTSAALIDARIGQQAYVAAGQGVDFWFTRTGTALQSVTDGLSALRQTADAGALTAIDEATATVTEFAAIDKRARDYLTSGEQLMAGDVIFTEGSEAAASAVRQIETARQAQHQVADIQTAGVRKQQMATAAAAAAFAVIVVLLLIPIPRGAIAFDALPESRLVTPAVVAATPRATPAAAAAPVVAPPPPAVPVVVVKPHAKASVLKAATAIVTDLGRVRDLDDLTRVLGRAAELMDANGLMVWFGSVDGADLRPALAHGYSPEMISRIPPVPRSADNAAAAAYRSGKLQIVLSRPGGANGAVVAPILAPDGCIGALSAEIRSGGETSDSVQALAAIFAAHLAGVLAAAPASAAEPAPEADIIIPRAAAANS